MTQESMQGWTRRQFARRMVGSAAGALMCAASETGAEEPPPARPDERIAQLEKERGRPLTEAQRKGIPGQLKELDEGAKGLRKYPLADGGSEPSFVFKP